MWFFFFFLFFPGSQLCHTRCFFGGGGCPAAQGGGGGGEVEEIVGWGGSTWTGRMRSLLLRSGKVFIGHQKAAAAANSGLCWLMRQNTQYPYPIPTSCFILGPIILCIIPLGLGLFGFPVPTRKTFPARPPAPAP